METILEFERPIATLEKKISELKELSLSQQVDFTNEISVLETKLQQLIGDVFSKLTPWQRVQLSRHPMRPYCLDYVSLVFDSFIELHGDRLFGDDGAMICGFAQLENKPVCVIGIQKGRNTKDKIARNFGMAKPEGYRKALRIMRMAGRFQMPIVTFIDTPGAYPGIEAEERGQAEAIATNIMEMFAIESPVLSYVIGEGGSGGALAIGVADEVLMLEYSTYSVISPESCASILWSESSYSEKAAEIMKMTPPDLLKLEVIDGIISEPNGGAHRDPDLTAKNIRVDLLERFKRLCQLPVSARLQKRHDRFRKIGLHP